MDWHEYISVDPNICHGQACIVGTRVMVTVILDNLVRTNSRGDRPWTGMSTYPSIPTSVTGRHA